MSMERKVYIDYIKALGILLVVLYHCSFVPMNSMLLYSTYAICVPLFFMVNGYLMLRKEHTIRELLMKDLKILFVLFFWAFIASLVGILSKGGVGETGLLDSAKELLVSTFTIRHEYVPHLWFLKVIIILNLLNPVIYSFINRSESNLKYLIILLSLFAVKFLAQVTGLIVNPLKWQYSYAILYYILGFALFDGHLRADKLKKWHIGLLIAVFALLQWGENWLFTEGPLHSIGVNSPWIIADDIVFYSYDAPFIVLLTLCVCALMQQISWKGNKVILFVGQYSLAIYVMQTPVQKMWEWVRSSVDFLYAIPYSWWTAILVILTLSTCMALTWLMLTNRVTKFLISM